MLSKVFVKFNGQAEEEEYPASARALGNTLIFHWNEKFWKKGVSYSDRMLAELTRIPKSTIQRARQFLIDKGWIITELLHGKTVYHLVFIEEKKQEAICAAEEEEEKVSSAPEEFDRWLRRLRPAERARLEGFMTEKNRDWLASVYAQRKETMAHPLPYLISIARKNPEGKSRRAKHTVYHRTNQDASEPLKGITNGTTANRGENGSAQGKVCGQTEAPGNCGEQQDICESPSPEMVKDCIREYLALLSAKSAKAFGSERKTSRDMYSMPGNGASRDELRSMTAGRLETVPRAESQPADNGRQNEERRDNVRAADSVESSKKVSGKKSTVMIFEEDMAGLSKENPKQPHYKLGQTLTIEEGNRAVFYDYARPDGSIAIKIYDANCKLIDITDTKRVESGKISYNGIVYPNFLDKAAPYDAGGNNATGNNAGGNNATGNNAAGNNATGDNAGGDNATGDNAGGDNATGNNATGNNASGDNATGNNAAGNNATGNNATGNNASGDNATGNNATGNNAT